MERQLLSGSKLTVTTENVDNEAHILVSECYSCTELYPSPTNNDMADPGLNWKDQTLYTTGEPVSIRIIFLSRIRG